MDTIARWSARERAELFQETAARMGMAPAIVEKDFWVCWTLGRLFAGAARPPALLFKGGTSLSKVYGVIQRFSEDIDLSVDRHDLGFSGERDPAAAPTRKAASRLLEELRLACSRHVAQVLLPAAEADFASVLGAPGAAWRLEVDAVDAQTVNFAYPPALAQDAGGYVRPVVRLELGARSDFWPAVEAEVRPYAAEHFPALFAEGAAAKVRVLEAKRTFWEKATLLHAEYHRPSVRLGAERLSRHYYDVVMLAETPIRGEALADPELLVRVAEHKERFFAAGWARYGEARPGTLRLVPHPELRGALEVDYAAMREMIFGEAPPFARIVERLAELEREINSPRAIPFTGIYPISRAGSDSASA